MFIHILFLLNFMVIIGRSVVGNTLTLGIDYTPCNTIKLQEMIDNANSGDIIKFSCGNEYKLILTNMIWIEKSLTIDGENNIILDGNGLFRQFIVGGKNTKWGVHAGLPIHSENIIFNLKNINLINGGGNTIYIGRRVNWGNPTCNDNCYNSRDNVNGCDINTCYTLKNDGGCLYLGKNINAIIDKVNFINCQSKGNPIYYGVNGDVDQTYRGGAIFNYAAGSDTTSDISINNCVFCSNFASEQGGALYIPYKSNQYSIRNSIFYGNIADGRDESGGGAIMTHETDITVDNCKFINNKAHLGGAIRVLISDITLSNSIFCSNTAVFDTTKISSNYLATGECCARGGAVVCRYIVIYDYNIRFCMIYVRNIVY